MHSKCLGNSLVLSIRFLSVLLSHSVDEVMLVVSTYFVLVYVDQSLCGLEMETGCTHFETLPFDISIFVHQCCVISFLN